QSGRWQPITKGINGYYQNLGPATEVYNGFNSSKQAIQIQVSGGNSISGGQCGNRFDLAGSVNGVGRVASTTTANDEWSKSGYISFIVPAQTNYSITSYPWGCAPGSFSIFSFIFN
ncbi:prepilin, shufflon protein A, partial [Chromobacterium subtsugae]|uniref:prepilin, shufflon protein A n=1 Tax=Chromobacterium subtsugae TaxID=251747 RepID=UPI0012FFBF79